MDCMILLCPAKKDVKRDSYQGSAADPSRLPSEEKANQQWDNNDAGEDQIHDKDKIP